MIKFIKSLICKWKGHSNPLYAYKAPPYFSGYMNGKAQWLTPIQPKRGFWCCYRCGGWIGVVNDKNLLER